MDQSPAPEDASRPRPVPFEDREATPGFWKRVGATFAQSFRDPMGMYARIGESGSLSAPWRFMVLLSVPVYLFLLIYALVGLVLLLSACFGPANQERLPMMVMGGIMVALPLFMPILQLLGMFLWGAVLHACLWLWGGTRNSAGLRQTVRAVGYTHAFVNLVCLVPIIGLAAALASPALLGMGLARVHRTDTWRGVCAAFTPVVLCLCLLVGSISLLVAWALRQSEKERQITMPPTLVRPEENRELPDAPQPNRA